MTTDFDFGGDLTSSPDFAPFHAQATSNLNFDNLSFDSVNSSNANPQTVSPKDVVMDVGFSAPQSAVLTNLSTPQTLSWDSPFGDPAFSNNTSPIFDDYDEELDAAASDWPSLFPSEFPDEVKQSIENPSPASDNSPSASTMTRNQSSPGQRHSSVSGVKKSRGRGKPLPDLDPEKVDNPVIKKRVRNTIAARKSRNKRAMEREAHLEEIAQLRHELDQTKAELERYKSLFKQELAKNYAPQLQ
ncbi:MAG: hypothetical protein LQ340_004445 [Diploschistes diacapsis]|nr:MAG: hypothetical protein LQ340_004445 [Diploschistes diacapsis]